MNVRYGRRRAFKQAAKLAIAALSGAALGPRLNEASAGALAGLGGAALPPQAALIDVGIRYVRVDGDDQQPGFSWETAMATVDRAYETLPSGEVVGGYPVNGGGGGKIVLGPGRHDVGDGLVLNRRKPIELEGIFRPERRVGIGVQGREWLASRGPTLYSSRNARWLVVIGPNGRDTEQNGYGHSIRKVTFELGAAMEGCVYLGSASFVEISDCGFSVAASGAGNVEAWAVVNENQGQVDGADASSLRLDDNSVRGMGLVQLRVTSPRGLNQNQHVISRNVCFGPPGRVAAAIELNHANRAVVRDNNLEGYSIGTHLRGGSWANLLIGNGGERVRTFALVEDSHANTIIDVGDSRPQSSGTTARLVEITSGATSNLIVQAVSTRSRDLYRRTEQTVSDKGQDNVVFGPTPGIAVTYDGINSAIPGSPSE